MTYKGKAYKRVASAQSKKGEDDDESSGYGFTTGTNSRAASDVCSSNSTSSTRGNSISKLDPYIRHNFGAQTNIHDVYAYNGTEICAGCLRKGNRKKKATHFCKTCDTYGRYICNTCLVDHDLWAGKDHDVVSLSVDRETYHTRANSVSDVMERPRTPLPEDDNFMHIGYAYIWTNNDLNLNTKTNLRVLPPDSSCYEDYMMGNSYLNSMQGAGMPPAECFLLDVPAFTFFDKFTESYPGYETHTLSMTFDDEDEILGRTLEKKNPSLYGYFRAQVEYHINLRYFDTPYEKLYSVYS